MRQLILFILIAIIAACNESGDNTDISAEDLAGTYSGTVPCDDCEGIEYFITLNDDLTFSDRMAYLGKNYKALIASGQYEINDGVIILNKPTDEFTKLRKHQDGLLLLDNEGQEVTDSTAGLYILRLVDADASDESAVSEGAASAVPDSIIKPRQDNTEVDEATRAKTERHITQWTEGVNFYALGTEPFWSLKIRFAEGMQFTTMDGYEIQTPMGDPSLREEGRFTKYTAVTESGELIVELEEAECSDQMSGEKFDYSVTIMTKKTVDREYQTFKGCGEYVVDPRLHNIWVIEEFEGEAIDHTKFQKGIPQIEINVRDDTYLGHDGCNSIRGGVVVEDRMITFEAGPATLMACENSELSQKISLALSETPYEFEIGRRLELRNNGEVRFVLRNVD